MIEHRKYATGLGDLLLIDAMIEDGIILQRDGSLLVAWQYTGPDMESADDSELNALVLRLNDALKLGSDWMIHCDVIRSEAPGYPESGSFPDSVSQIIDEERRQQFTAAGAQYQSEYFIALTYLPPSAKQQKGVSWLVGGSNDSAASQHIARFRAKLEQFENVFASQLKAERLQRKGEMDELLRYIHRCVTGHNHPIRLPSIPIGLNDLLSSEDFSGGTRPRIGAQHIAVVAIDGFPKVSKPGIIGALDQLPIAYRWSTRAILMDPEQATEMLGKARKKWKSTERGFAAQVMKAQSAPVNLDSLEMQADAAEATKSASQNTVHFCMYTSVVVILDEDSQRLKESTRQVQRTLQNLGFPARLETVNAIEAWRGSIPGDGYCNVRRVQLHTLNLADMLPITSVWTGLEFCPSNLMPDSPALLHAETTGSTRFRLNLHVGDLGHTVLIGPSGAGKSTALGLIAAQWFRYPGAQVFAFDWDYSIWLLTHALAGKHFDLMGQRGLAFCPLRHLETQQDRSWAAAYIEDLCKLSGMSVRPKHRNAINAAIVQLVSEPAYRSLTHFCGAVQDDEIRDALEHYTVSGAAGHLLDAEQDTLSFGGARMVSFETRGLMESRDTRTALPVLLYLFRRIEQRLDGSPTLILLDEAWAYLAHEVFAGKLWEWLRTMRRRNAAVIIATQQISDVMNSRIADTVLAQCPTKILLPNAEARNPANAEFYRQALGMNERELWMLQNALPKRDYYVTSSLGKRMVNLCMGDVGLAFCSINAPQERAAVERLMVAYPEMWPSEWLRARGATAWADYLAGREDKRIWATA